MTTHTLQPPEWIDAAPIRVERSIEIAAPPAAVWARIADHRTWPEWFTAVDSVDVLGAPEGVGGGRRVTVGKLTLDEEFTAWDVDEHFAFSVIASKLPILESLAESVRIVPTAGGSRVVYRQGVQAKRGFGTVLGLMWKRAARQLQPSLANLKQQLEPPTS
jgi:carbon monoxide dehydrogenase subunit G